MLPAQRGLYGGYPAGRHAQRADPGLDESARGVGVARELAADADGFAGVDGVRDQLQDRRERLLEQRRERRVAALGGHRVLREIVRAYAEEVDVEVLGLERQRGLLDHHADGKVDRA